LRTARLGSSVIDGINLGAYNHIVVIYQENHSFDNLYGMWGDVAGKRVNDLRFVDVARQTQTRFDGTAYSCLLQNDVNLEFSGAIQSSCADPVRTPSGATINSAFTNKPFKLDDFLPSTDKTCPAPGFVAKNGLPRNANGALPGGCTEDMVHRFYNEQFQINRGKQNRFVLGSDAAGLTMGYYDTTKLPIYAYLHKPDAPNYVIADNFFQAAFGGSFINHHWLVAARTPVFKGAANDGSENDLHSTLDANLLPTSTPLYANGLDTAALDLPLTQSCKPAAGRPPTQKDAVCGDYAVNTIQPFTWPYKPTDHSEARRLPPLTAEDNPTIGDRLNERDIDWAWYSGGWDNAEGNANGPGWTNGGAGSCSDPNARQIIVGGALRCPDKNFQYHHQPFNYYAKYAPGEELRRKHLLDEAAFILAAKGGKLKPISFVKPIGEENEHPGYAGETQGSQHLVNLIDAIVSGPNRLDTLIIVTYDEFGGSWDHVPPPPYNDDGAAPSDIWGPGTRVPALVISAHFTRSGVDHVMHDTTAILKLIEQRFGLAPLSARDAAVNSLATALQQAEE
jgi:acid phosphatase